MDWAREEAGTYGAQSAEHCVGMSLLSISSAATMVERRARRVTWMSCMLNCFEVAKR